MGYSMFVSGLTHHDRKRALPGYTVYSTMSGDAVYLIDMDGKVVHQWPALAGTRVFYGHLLENGNLLVNASNGSEIGEGGGPRTAVVAEIDWAGQCAWFFADPLLHHAHARLANGNTMVMATHVLDAEDAGRVIGSESGQSETGALWSEALWEVTPSGDVAWQWRAIDHLDPEQYRLPAAEPGRTPAGVNAGGSREWLHLNAVEELPDGDLLLSFNTLSTVIIIDRNTGSVTWRAVPETSGQHNPTWLPEGRVLLFDNGSRRGFSRVIEIDRRSNQVAWEYTGRPRDSFYSMNISGAQRLPNGNTLVTEGRSGRLFEVTREGDTVWEFINRAYRYAADSAEIAGRI
jgi:hypothetical protein